MTDEELLSAIRAIVREEVTPLIEWIENRREKDRERQRKRYETSREVFSRENQPHVRISPDGSSPSSPSHTLPLTPTPPLPLFEQSGVIVLEGVQGEPKVASAPKLKQQRPKDWDEFWTYCQKKGVKHDEAVYYFSTWEANGWTTNKQPIKSWRAKVVSWHTIGYFDSNKNNGTLHPR